MNQTWYSSRLPVVVRVFAGLYVFLLCCFLYPLCAFAIPDGKGNDIFPYNVGVNTTAPMAKLQVDGAIYGGLTAPTHAAVDMATSGDAMFSGDMEIDGALYVDGFIYGNGSKLTGISSGGTTISGLTANNVSKANAAGTNFIDSAIYDVNGNVGIGSSSPEQPLDINGHTRISASDVRLYLRDLDNLSTATFMFDGTSLNFGSNSSAGVFNKFTSSWGGWENIEGLSGNVTMLQVLGRMLSSSTASSYTGLDVFAEMNQSGTATGNYTLLKLNVTETSFLGADGRLFDAQVGGVSKMTIRNTGNIGIGSTAPVSKLDLVGAGTTSATSALTIRDSTGAATVTVLDNGNVGIGTALPAARLEVSSGQVFSRIYALTDGATIAIDWDNGNIQSVTLGGNRAITFAHGQPGARYQLIINQGTGSHTITSWNTGNAVKWPSGSAPTLSTGASAIDIITIIFDGTSYYGVASLNFS